MSHNISLVLARCKPHLSLIINYLTQMPSFAATIAVIYLAFCCSIRHNVLTLEIIQIHYGTYFPLYCATLSLDWDKLNLYFVTKISINVTLYNELFVIVCHLYTNIFLVLPKDHKNILTIVQWSFYDSFWYMLITLRA